MMKNKRISQWMQRAVALLVIVSAIASIGLGIFGHGKRRSATSTELLNAMRVRMLLSATGEGAVESFVSAAKKQAADKAKADGATMAERREASEKAEAEARANYTNTSIDFSTIDEAVVVAISESALAMREAMIELDTETQKAHEAYIQTQTLNNALPATDAEAAVPDVQDEIIDELALPEEPAAPKVDMSGFVATEEMVRLSGVVDLRYDTLGEGLMGAYPALDTDALTQLQGVLSKLIYVEKDTFNTEYDRLYASGGAAAVSGNVFSAAVMRHANSLVTVGVGLFILAILILFYAPIVGALGVPRLIIGGFFVLLCVVSIVLELSLASLLSNTIVRMGMNSVMVLAMLPAIQCGISLNLGLPVGILGGLIGGLLCIELGFSGWWGFLFAMAVGLAISVVVGILYGMLLNRLKGNEMAVTTYVGFSIVSLMCIAWLMMPFRSLELRWPLGVGLRQTISMKTSFSRVLDGFWAFSIGNFKVPTGLLLFMLLCCVIVWLFMRSKTGIAMAAVGNNPRFAEATGINVNRMRIIGTTFSTMLGAVGILVYSQSFGFLQLYTHPRTLGLVAASAILIGGASTSRAKISHVLIGTFLFQGVLTLGMPVANALVPGSTIAETMRILVSNGIILYALTKSGGGSRA